MGGHRILIENRFWDKVDKTDTCWLWTSADDGNGYGIISARPYPKKAHRVSWELTHGPIPEGLFVLHKCDVRLCVNPEHLFLGTQADNMADAVAKGRAAGPEGEKAARAVLTDKLVREIRASTLPTADLARELGLGHSAVYHARKRLTWKHIKCRQRNLIIGVPSMNINLPSFLVGVELTDEEKVKYQEYTSNWVKLHAEMGEWGEEQLLKALLTEVTGRNRHDIVSRLRKKFEIVRSDRENLEMQSLWETLESA